MTVESSRDTSEQLAATFAPVVDEPIIESADEPAEVVPVEAKAEPKPKPRNDPQARVEAATAKEAAAKRERDEAKAETVKLNARIAELEARSAPKPAPVAQPSADAEPTVDQFDSYEKFVKAQARWEARQEIRQQEESRQKHAADQQREHYRRETNEAFDKRYQAALAEDNSFVASVDARLMTNPPIHMLPDGAEPTFDNYLVTQVFHSAHPKQMLLHLSDPAVYQRLATLPQIQADRELAIYEHSLSAASPAAPAPKAPAVSHAKPPIQPVGSSPFAADADDTSDPNLSVDEHIRRENAKERRARRAS